MILVARLFPRSDLRTEVWISDTVREAIGEYHKIERKPGSFLAKLQLCATAGFANYEGDKKCPIRYEWDGVYRIGLHADLFRVYGFYEEPNKRSFIAVDALIKKGQKLTRHEKDRINEVARVKETKDWFRRED